jgi:glucosamine-phosphate N-acetyltransferase
MQGSGFGLFMIDKIKTHNKDCYKIILDCSEPIAGFYEKCGFSAKGIQMAIYTPEPPIRTRENHP